MNVGDYKNAPQYFLSSVLYTVLRTQLVLLRNDGTEYMNIQLLQLFRDMHNKIKITYKLKIIQSYYLISEPKDGR
jgi:hypothetical protein